MSCGIYKITNIINGKIYIGCSLDCEQRFIKHKSKLNKNKSNNQHLQNAWNKDGKDNFTFEIIFLCSPQDLGTTEIYFIYKMDAIKCGYNKSIGGENYSYGINHPFYGRKVPKDVCDKISKTLIDKDLRGVKSNRYGKHNTDEAKLKISIANTGRKQTQETIEKRRLLTIGKKRVGKALENLFIGAQKRSIPILQYDLNDNFIRRWENGSEAGRQLNINIKHLPQHLKQTKDGLGKIRRSVGGFKWRYA